MMCTKVVYNQMIENCKKIASDFKTVAVVVKFLVPIGALRWYRLECYDGTDSSAAVVPIQAL